MPILYCERLCISRLVHEAAPAERPPAASVRQSASVGAHLARRGIHAVAAATTVLNAFVATKAAIARTHDPTQVDQLLARGNRNALLQPQDAGGAVAGQVLAHALR